MKFFNEEINFELGPSHGFKQIGAICTCDLCQYMSLNGTWYRVNLTEREIIKNLQSCKSEEELLEKLKAFIS